MNKEKLVEDVRRVLGAEAQQVAGRIIERNGTVICENVKFGSAHGTFQVFCDKDGRTWVVDNQGNRVNPYAEHSAPEKMGLNVRKTLHGAPNEMWMGFVTRDGFSPVFAAVTIYAAALVSSLLVGLLIHSAGEAIHLNLGGWAYLLALLIMSGLGTWLLVRVLRRVDEVRQMILDDLAEKNIAYTGNFQFVRNQEGFAVLHGYDTSRQQQVTIWVGVDQYYECNLEYSMFLSYALKSGSKKPLLSVPLISS